MVKPFLDQINNIMILKYLFRIMFWLGTSLFASDGLWPCKKVLEHSDADLILILQKVWLFTPIQQSRQPMVWIDYYNKQRTLGNFFVVGSIRWYFLWKSLSVLVSIFRYEDNSKDKVEWHRRPETLPIYYNNGLMLVMISSNLSQVSVFVMHKP